jgi:hypothetical protein
MQENKESVEWSEFLSNREATQNILSNVTKSFLEPRGIKKDGFFVMLLASANNYLLMLDRAQESLKTRFSKNEWLAIEMAVVDANEGNSAGPSLVDAINFEFSKNMEIKHLGVDLARTIKKLNTLTPFEKDAIADAGRKSRSYPKMRLFDLLGTKLVQDYS